MKRLILLGVVAAGIAVVKLLPWWAGLAVLIGLVLAAKLFAGRLLKRFFMGLFKAKGAALAGADATLHGITAAQPPKPDPDDEGGGGELEQGPLRWVHIDLTVHVPDDNTGKTPFRLWDPHELCLVPVDTKPGPPDEDGDEDLGTIAGAEVHDNGSWVTAEGKLEGSHRIRLHAGVKPGVQHFKLRYYFEIIENRDTVRR
jgi:hypothetical protein